MQIDELRGELTSLADELEPFEGDVRALHRRERRRRVVMSSLAVALVAIVGVSTIAVARHNDNDRVRVTAGPDKEVPPQEITHIDAIIVPASPAVKAVLDSSPLVTKYARIPHGDRSSYSLFFLPNDGLCAFQTNDAYAVDEKTPGANAQGALTLALAGEATAYDVSDRFGSDIEFFLKVGASARQAESLRAALSSDPDILSVHHVSTADAYARFKKDFADQPALVASTKPSDLPESFRVVLRADRSVPKVDHRYKDADGVETAISLSPNIFFGSVLTPSSSATTVSPCAKP